MPFYSLHSNHSSKAVKLNWGCFLHVWTDSPSKITLTFGRRSTSMEDRVLIKWARNRIWELSMEMFPTQSMNWSPDAYRGRFRSKIQHVHPKDGSTVHTKAPCILLTFTPFHLISHDTSITKVARVHVIHNSQAQRRLCLPQRTTFGAVCQVNLLHCSRNAFGIL